MSFSVDLINLVLYCIQQVGVMLAVGAETILLVAYFLSTRDGRIESKEEQFGRAVHRALRWGLVCIVLSGLAITAVHIFGNQWEIVLAPAFLLKWLLIALVGMLELARHKQAFAHFVLEGLTGALWYALFVLHILAPVATWGDLLVLWAMWTAGFMACFAALVHAARVPVRASAPAPTVVEQPKSPIKPPEPKKSAPPQSVHSFATPKPVPVVHKPVPVSPPAVVHAHTTLQVAPSVLPTVMPPQPHTPPAYAAPPVPRKPAPVIPPLPHKPQNKMLIPTKPGTHNPAEHAGLPAIRVMPRTEEDMHKQNFAVALQSR